MTANRHARSCGAPPGAPISEENPMFAGVFDSYRAHSDPHGQAETRLAPCVRRAIGVGFGHAVPPSVPPPKGDAA